MTDIENSQSCRLIVICGLPGSGKTTLAKKIKKPLSIILFCLDEWMQALWELA